MANSLSPPSEGGSKYVFLHQIDTFEMNAIKKSLIEENFALNCSKYEIIGSLNQPENLVKVMHGRHPVEILYSNHEDYFQRIIACDIIVFNSDSPNFENVCLESRRVITALEEWTNEQKKIVENPEDPPVKKHLILISTPMTWAFTTPDIVGTEEEELFATDYLYEENYRRRKAHRGYCKHKLLERDIVWVQKKCKHFVKTLVVCPGVIYGEENHKLHYIFKLGFYNKLLPIARPGNQYIPLIYIKDFVQIMKILFDDFPESKIRYIFAVQHQLVSLKSFTYHMSKSFNGDCSKIRYLREVEMLMMEKSLFPQSTLDVLSLNIKLTPTYFKDFQFQIMTNEFWDVLAQEFRDARNLHPLKLVIDGPPLVGKTEHARKLAEYYNLLYIDINYIIKEYIKHLEEKINDSILVVENFECPEKIEQGDGDEEVGVEDEMQAENINKFDEEDEELLTELKFRVETWSKELFQLKVYIASHKTFEEQDFDKISTCLIALLSTKQYNLNQGYIIDCFPFTYNQANEIYYNTRRVDPLLATNFILPGVTMTAYPVPPLKPTHFIMFDASDELLCKRAMGFTETEAIMRRCLRHQMLPRLDAYRERNDEPNCLANLFYDNELIPISIYCEQQTLAIDTLRTIKMTIGHPFIYPLTSEQQKALNEALAEKRRIEEEEKRRKQEELVRSLTLKRERKILNWTARYEELRKHEHEMREVKTLPLRQYLGKYVLPTLTEGILKIAELKPDDPVDFLAEYLFKCNPEGQQMPPYCTEEQKMRFYETFNDDMTSDSDYLITHNKMEYECPDEENK